MADWKQLVEGLEIKERKGNLPQELINRLDLVYYLGNDDGIQDLYGGVNLQHSVQSVGGVVIEIRKILTPRTSSIKVTVADRAGITIEGYDHSVTVKEMREDKTLEELFIFGAFLSPCFKNYAATPLFCLGEKPEGEDMGGLNCTRYQGLCPVDISKGLIKIDQNRWEGAIDIHKENGKGSVFFGCGQSEEAVLFDQLIPFDLEKRLILARSPNGSVSFDHLHKIELPERGKKVEYSLIYDNVKSLQENKTWTVNNGRYLSWENNPSLNLYTKTE